jgi:hypothetical protein
MAAHTAKDRFFVKLCFGPGLGLVAFSIRVTFRARVPPTAAAKLYRDDVRLAVVMYTTRLSVDEISVDSLAADQDHDQSTFAVNVMSLVFGG